MCDSCCHCGRFIYSVFECGVGASTACGLCPPMYLKAFVVFYGRVDCGPVRIIQPLLGLCAITKVETFGVGDGLLPYLRSIGV